MVNLLLPLSLFLLPSALGLECRPKGVIFPRPRNLEQSETFQNALDTLTTTLNAAFNGDIRAGWDIRNVSLSMALAGFDQTESSTPVWEYHHLASGNVNGTKSLDKHSQYLIGSVSKVITDAILIRTGVNMDDPVIKYLPVLNNNTTLIDWNNISLRALGGHLAGIAPNSGFSEYYYLKTWFETLGFPHVSDSSFPPCGVIGLNKECTKSQFLAGMLTSRPIAPPQSRPIYSNIAYTVLSYSLEAATGKNYSTLLREMLTVPLNMPSTAPSPGNNSLAVIPPVANNWGSPYGDNVAGGGLVSSLADLTSFVHAILARNPALATETEIREWLQPRSFTGSRSSFVGFPWEIFRPQPGLLFPRYNETTQEGGHTVTIHAKDGAAYGYHVRIALLDDYGVGLVLLTAGDQIALSEIYDAALSILVPAIDAVASEQAEKAYVGTFTGLSTEETGHVKVNATTETDGISLKLSGLYRNGTDVLAGLDELWKATVAGFLPPLNTVGVYRLYPADVERKRVLPDGSGIIEEDWRLLREVRLESETEMPGKGISDNDCLYPWTLGDWVHYGSEAVDRIVFVKDEKGTVLGIDAPFLRTQTMRKSGPRGDL